MKPPVLFVVALPSEARAVIEHYRLRRDAASHAFPVYHNVAQDIWLVVSGVGKVCAAAACAHLYHFSGGGHAVWLNVGVAGHAIFACGQAMVAHSITDAANGRTSYPPLLYSCDCPSAALLTVEYAVTDYPAESAVDMEASAYFAVATRYTTAELVQVIKIVSDNAEHSIEQVTPQTVSEWIAGGIDVLVDVVDQLRLLGAQIATKELKLPTCLQRFHFSFSQQLQCYRLLHRWYVLSDNKPLPAAGFTTLDSGRDALFALHALLDQQAISYST